MRILAPEEVSDSRLSDRWQPMRVIAYMAEPVVTYGDGLMLDGPLAYGAFLEFVREHGPDALPPMTPAEAVDFDLPLAIWVERGAWGWCCSRAHAEWLAENKVELRKKPALEEMRRYTEAKNHHISLGPHKARDLAYPSRFAFEVEWYALGDRERVAALLGRVSHIGKLCNHGYGKVLRWVVEPMGPLERDRWMARHMPAEGGRMLPVRAPYHHRSRRAPCL